MMRNWGYTHDLGHLQLVFFQQKGAKGLKPHRKTEELTDICRETSNNWDLCVIYEKEVVVKRCRTVNSYHNSGKGFFNLFWVIIHLATHLPTCLPTRPPIHPSTWGYQGMLGSRLSPAAPAGAQAASFGSLPTGASPQVWSQLTSEGEICKSLAHFQATSQYWLVVWNMNFIFPEILGIIIPIDFHIFQRGGPTTNQNRIE